ncbi:MAG: exo-1,3-beta-glucanase [Sclerophora amabilis]|nr:MAG: exo-1,3-beta-glucanase [Sclerophora amabilis]
MQPQNAVACIWALAFVLNAWGLAIPESHLATPCKTLSDIGTRYNEAPASTLPVTGSSPLSGDIISPTPESPVSTLPVSESSPLSEDIISPTPERPATTLPVPSSSTLSGDIVSPSPQPSTRAFDGPDFLRGVNIGGWLVIEKWMNWELFAGFDASDQHSFDSQPGAEAALQNHWNTWFKEEDVQNLKSNGINAMRIPIGFWAYDNDNTPYLKGADAFLDKAIGWARGADIKVWVDLHGAPGSQNGFDNSGRAGSVEWQQGDNIRRTISVLKTMAEKYGAQQYADVVIGLELINEPISWGSNNIETTKRFAADAYAAVRAAAANPDLMIIMHDAFQGANSWNSFARELNAGDGFGIDAHLYQIFVEEDLQLTQAQHIEKACGWSSGLADANSVMPTFVGEFSASSQICVNPDGSTTAGTSCSVEGCQCQSAEFDQWNDVMVEQARRFVEAQLDTFEANSRGYFMWAWKGPGSWGFTNGIAKGIIPNPVTDRKYPGQCDK